jgi:hypothetical protein
MDNNYFIDTLLTDIAKHLPDNTPYESIKKIAIFCITYSIRVCEMTQSEKENLINTIIKDF